MSGNDGIPWTATSDEFDALWTETGPDGKVWNNTDADGVPDILATIFAKQRAAYEAYIDIYAENGYERVLPEDFGAIDKRHVQDSLRDVMGYVIEELNEARNHLKAKPWKRTFKEPDAAAFNEELADAVHFFVELLIVAGWNAEDVFRHYFAKAIENSKRRASDY